MSPFYIALVHHPVRDRLGEIVTTAVTNLDVHDLARSARTYDLAGYFLVTPIGAQRAIVERILEHWRTGPGVRRVPERAEALALVEPVSSLSDAIAAIAQRHGRRPFIVATTARLPAGASATPFEVEAARLADRVAPTLLIFGTGHGLTDEVLHGADALLAPIRPSAGFNHLSVRAAAAICLDRLLGEGTAASASRR